MAHFFTKRNKLLLFTLVLILLIPLVLTLINSRQIIKQEAAESWVYLGTHPAANTQGSAIGKTLCVLQSFNGRLYMGYGDAGANTGPVYVSYYDPVQNTFILSHLLQSESIDTLNPVNGKLYALVSDRKGTAISYTSGEPWVDKAFTGADSEHNYDLKTLTGSDLWLSTSYAAGRIWRSTDGGNNWTNSLTINTTTGRLTSPVAVRFTFLGIYNGKLYTQAHDRNNTSSYAHSSSRVFDGNKWTTGPDLLPNKTRDRGTKANVFGGKMVYKSNILTTSADLYVFNGTSVTTPFGRTMADYTIDGTTLYVLATDKTVSKTTDLTNWTTLSTAPANASSIGVLNGQLYVGTSDSQLYVYTDPTTITPSPTLTPTLRPTSTPSISTTPSSPTGDYNSDTNIDLLDFNFWRNEFLGISTTVKSDGNKDGTVDLIDFNLWLTAFRSA